VNGRLSISIIHSKLAAAEVKSKKRERYSRLNRLGLMCDHDAPLSPTLSPNAPPTTPVGGRDVDGQKRETGVQFLKGKVWKQPLDEPRTHNNTPEPVSPALTRGSLR
jgi:hypothetical protein